MNLELCPFCGKPFKRLKSHLPHCKMSPDFKTSKYNEVPKDLPTAKQKPRSLKKNTHLSDLELNDLSYQADSKRQKKNKSQMNAAVVKMDKCLSQTPSFKLANTVPKDCEQGVNPHTVKPKSKWLAKREQEILKQVALLKQKEGQFISDHRQEDHKILPETSTRSLKEPQKNERRPKIQDQKRHQRTSITSLVTTKIDDTASNLSRKVSCITSSEAEQSIQKQKANENVLVKTLNIPNTLNNDSLISQIKHREELTLFQTKTCVWDHIKSGLYDKRSDFMPVVYSIVVTHNMSGLKSGNISTSVHLPTIENNQCAVTKAFSVPLFPICQTSVQRPAEDMVNSKSQSMTVMGMTPDMETGYGRTLFSSSNLRISSNVCSKSQSLKLQPQSQGPVIEQKLGCVKLNELAAWFGERTPKSTREAAMLLNKGWQWYYRKYIDVQKGGIGGLAMLIAGYCALSYAWSYPHLKKERWRKYH